MEQADRAILAIDLGGTQIRVALVTPDLAVACRVAAPTQDEAGVDATVARICDLAVEVRDRARAEGRPQPIGIGISSPGPLDPWRGIVLAPPNLSGWRDVPLADAVEDAVGLPAFLERDTNVALMAEWRHGAARGTRHAVYITISTGIGGAIVADGRPLVGPDGAAGEIGHVTVEVNGPRCGCGRPGHVEAIASGTALARQARALLDAGASPALAELAAAGHEVDAELLARAADAGDAACRETLDRAWSAVAATCASLLNLLNPEVIVFGGSIATHQPSLVETVIEQLPLRAFDVPTRRVRIELAHFGDDVSLIGSLPIVNERISDPAFRRDARREAATPSSAGQSRGVQPR